jgi:hypothetical protein
MVTNVTGHITVGDTFVTPALPRFRVEGFRVEGFRVEVFLADEKNLFFLMGM